MVPDVVIYKHALCRNKVAQPSASWRSGGGLLSALELQITPQVASGHPRLRPASANQPLAPRWPAIRALFSS
eukprot:scaffold8150_cov72-Phaeocystis_antarctica.AAC.17